MIWDYDQYGFGVVMSLIDAFCLLSNVLSLQVVVECTALQAALCVLCGIIAQLATTIGLHLSKGRSNELLCEFGTPVNFLENLST
jgi:hypothetical protein